MFGPSEIGSRTESNRPSRVKGYFAENQDHAGASGAEFLALTQVHLAFPALVICAPQEGHDHMEPIARCCCGK